MTEGGIVALAADMIFASRIRGAATAASTEVELARDPADFLAKIKEFKPRLAILDLDRRGLDVATVIRDAKAAADTQLLVYVSHVRADLIAAARQAGADRIMARGAFANQMTELLKT